MTDLAVLTQDPAFGGGASAQTEAFVGAASLLGRRPELLFARHPALSGRRITPRRIESIRQLTAARRLAPSAAAARSLWVVATIATHGGAAASLPRRYGCWLGTSLDDEWRGRALGLDPLRRAAQRLNAPALRRLERAVVRNAARVYATGASSQRAVAAAAGIAEDDIGILPLPVDVTRFAPEPDEQWLERLTEPSIVFVGRANDPRKNLRLLLEAHPQIPGRLVLVGAPPSRRLPPRVEALGTVPDVAAVIRTASLLVLPSWQEGFGIVAAEALASGVPVLTTPCGGPEQLVRESGGGRVLETFDAEELAATATELLEAPGTLAKMRVAGRQHVVREHAPERFRTLLAAALAAVDQH
jgi:glycosyltransferase involved in cell wall biosynthesis